MGTDLEPRFHIHAEFARLSSASTGGVVCCADIDGPGFRISRTKACS